MYPKEDIYICRKCLFQKKKSGRNIVKSIQRDKEVTIIENNENNVLPKTKIKCPKCENNEAFWIMRQMRGSDEPESRFYTCTKCNHRWRED
jgi:DNA-directed RNA polymerase subunit M